MSDGDTQIKKEPDQLAGQEDYGSTTISGRRSNSNSNGADSSNTNTTTKEVIKELARQWDDDDRTMKRKSLGSSSSKKKRSASVPGVTQVSTTKNKRLSFPNEKFGSRPPAIAGRRAISTPATTLRAAGDDQQRGGLGQPWISGPIIQQMDQYYLDGEENHPNNRADFLDYVPVPPGAPGENNSSQEEEDDEENQKDSRRGSLLVEASLVAIEYDEEDEISVSKQKVKEEQQQEANTDNIPQAEVVQQGNLLLQFGPKSAGSRWLCFGISALIALVAATGIVCGSGACTPPTDNQPQLSTSNDKAVMAVATTSSSIPTPSPIAIFPGSQISIQETTKEPTLAPTTFFVAEIPSNSATISPTQNPSTTAPSYMPTVLPSNTPTTTPSVSASSIPTPAPTSVSPTQNPSATAPSYMPTVLPSNTPTTTPSASPSSFPTLAPTTTSPTQNPSTEAPTYTPTVLPSNTPTTAPSLCPTSFPTLTPTSASPTLNPTTSAPSSAPTTSLPSNTPTLGVTKARTKCDKLYESAYPFGYESAYPLSSVALNCQPFDEPDPTTLHGVLYGCNTLNQGAPAPPNIKSLSFTEVCVAAVTEQTSFTCYQMAADTDYTSFRESVDKNLICKDGDAFDTPKYMYLQTTAAYYAGGGSGSQSTQIPMATDSFSGIEDWVNEAYYVGTVTSRLPEAQQRGMPAREVDYWN